MKELAKIQKISKKCSVCDIHCSSLLEDASRNVQYVHFFFRSFLLNLRRYFFFVALNSFFRSHTCLFSSQQSEGPLKVTKAKRLIHGVQSSLWGHSKGGKIQLMAIFFEVYLKTWDVIFVNRHDVIAKLEDVFLTIVEDLSKDKPPSLKYNSRTSWKNTR